MSLKEYIVTPLLLTSLILIASGCRKMIEIDPPVTSVTTEQTFSTDEQAMSSIAGIYIRMINPGSGALFLCNGATSIYCGMSADELIPYDQKPSDGYVLFQKNNLSSITSLISEPLWTQGYLYIYGANAIIQGVQTSKSISDSVRRRLTGEAKFVRAFCYFYLTNLYGEIPMPLTIDFHKTATLSRAHVENIYQQIINDLIDAQQLLPVDFSAQQGERVIPNKWAATALLARVYLYQGEWEKASTQASTVINQNNLFNLPALKEVFSKNSTEAIWQLKQNPSSNPFNITTEGSYLVPIDSTYAPFAFLTDTLLNSFEANDQRKTEWVRRLNFDDGSGVISNYYYPFKYTQGGADQLGGGVIKQYYIALRLAEQYLIRAEAMAKQNKLDSAIRDINSIRVRAGLLELPLNLSQEQILSQVEHERQVELFVEWGHRWLDLKRTNRANSILSNLKGSDWNATDVLYPIPLNEIRADPKLTQNDGY